VNTVKDTQRILAHQEMKINIAMKEWEYLNPMRS
jgi:hypothetical protein